MILKQSFRFSYLAVLLVLLNTTSGYRNYIAVFEDVKCSSTGNTLKTISCRIDTSSSLNIDAELQNEIIDYRAEISTLLILESKEIKNLFHVKAANACNMFDENVFNPTLKIVKNIVSKFCNLPKKCPIPANFVFKMSNLTINTEYLPMYIPPCVFKVYIKFYNGKPQFLNINIVGRVIYKKIKAKGHKTPTKY